MKKTAVWKKKICAWTGSLFIAGTLLLSPREAGALKAVVLLEVTGIFEALDETTVPNVIFLKVEDKEASGPLRDGCVFFDEREKDLPQGDFVKRYINRFVTLEIVEDTGEVFCARPATVKR